MNTNDFKYWLKLYGQAWEDKDAKRFSELFSENAKYYWTPFEEPKNGKFGIREAVENAISTQENIKFGSEILPFGNNTGICR